MSRLGACVVRITQRLWFRASQAAVVALTVLVPQAAFAQGPELVPLLTDRTIEPSLSTSFGSVGAAAVNSRGDLVFTSGGGSALFFRAGGGNWPDEVVARILQRGDELPEFPGGLVTAIASPEVNAQGLVAFTTTLSLPTGVQATALYSYDGTSFRLIADGGFFGITLIGINDAGTIAFRTLADSGTTVSIVRADGAPVRLAGTGDDAPGTGGTFSTLVANGPGALNELDEVLFRAIVSTGGAGIFVASEAGVRKVVAVADPLPDGGNVTSLPNTPQMPLSDAGFTAFVANNALWLGSPDAGLSRVIGTGDPAPSGLAGSVSSVTPLTGNGAGHFIAMVSMLGRREIIRFGPGDTHFIVGDAPAAMPGVLLTPLSTFQPSIAIDATSGDIAFPAFLTDGAGQLTPGVFTSSGGDVFPRFLNDQPAGLAGGETFWFGNTTGPAFVSIHHFSASGLFFTARLRNGPTEAGTFRDSGGPVALVTTAAALPAGSKTQIVNVSGAGDYVAFSARRAGGQLSLGVYRIDTQQTDIRVSEGDIAPDSGGARYLTLSAFQASAGGQVSFMAALAGGSAPNGIYASTAAGVLKVALDGETTAGDVAPLSGVAITTIGTANESGQVLFTSSALRVHLGMPGGIPVRVIGPGDPLPGGGTYPSGSGSLALPRALLGEGGHIAFAMPGGLFVRLPDGSLIKVARSGEPAPGGATFSRFSMPVLGRVNRSGEFPFLASFTDANGVARSGVFLGGPTGWTTVALEGDPAPGGGTFPALLDPFMSSPAQVNDDHDVAFTVLTSGEPGGVYVRRAATGILEAVARVGQPAPGSPVSFDALAILFMNDAGDIAVLGSAPPIGQDLWSGIGTWHVAPDNSLQEILVRGTIAPEFGGGSIVNNAWSTTWNSDRRYALTGVISGGAFLSGVFLYVPPTSSVTPVGIGVVVAPKDSVTRSAPVTLTFDTVTAEGETALTISAGGPALPSAFALGDPPVFYNLETTAEFDGFITVCIETAGTAFDAPAGLRLLHFTGTWEDVTTSAAGTVVCGRTDSLSPFTVAASQIDPLPPVTCDIDGDRDVDLTDLQAIRAALRTPAAAGDPRDGNGDGWINIADVRYCQLRIAPAP